MRFAAVRNISRVVRETVQSVRERAENGLAVGLQTGIAFDLHPRGIATAARLLLKGGNGPSSIYRIHAANTPNRVALVFGEQRFTYKEFDSLCDRIAAGLAARGLAGKTILVATRNCPEFLALGTAASRVGAATVTVSWRSTPAELTYLGVHCGASACVFDESSANGVEIANRTWKLPRAQMLGLNEAANTPFGASFSELLASHGAHTESAEEGSVVVYTSGTTGKPKGAVRKFNKDLLPSVIAFLRDTPFQHDDIHLTSCPLYHTTAFGFIAFTQVLGGTVVLLPEFEPTKFLEAVARHKVTTTVLVPTMLHRLLKLGDDVIQRFDTRTLNALFCTSAPLPGPDSTQAMNLFGDIVYNLYGATETGAVTLAHPEDLRRSPGTIGRAVRGTSIRLLDDQGQVVPQGQVGELFAHNAMLVSGYHNDDEATAGSMREGYFSVGDTAYEDARGCYHLAGRKRDMVISGGVNVYPAEVEATLEEHPWVDEVAVVGVVDPEWGERVQAVVVLTVLADRTMAEATLKTWCKSRLAGPKVPREFVFLPVGEVLPRNATGKVLKRDLRARASMSTEKSV